MKMADGYRHVAFESVFEFLSKKEYPASVKDKGAKANFRRCCKAFLIENGVLFHLRRENKVGLLFVTQIIKMTTL